MVLPAPAANFEKIGYNLVKKTPLLTGSPGALLQSQNCRWSGSGLVQDVTTDRVGALNLPELFLHQLDDSSGNFLAGQPVRVIYPR